MYYNIDKVSYGILREYLKSSRGYTNYEIGIFMELGNGRTRYTIEQAGLKLCDMCDRTIMWEGFLHEQNSETYCEDCVMDNFSPTKREILYDHNIMFWTEFHSR